MSFLDKVKAAKAEAQDQSAAQSAAHAAAQAATAPSPEPVATAPAPAKGAMSFRDRLRSKPIAVIEADVAEAPAEAPTEAPEPVVAPASAILSPDAAARTTTPERGAELRGEAQAKVDKKAKKKTARKGKHKRELTLYFNCTPQKGEHQGNFVLIEDLMQDILAVVNAEVAEKTGGKIIDYRELSYSDEKMALANVVQQYIEAGELPIAIAILGSGQGTEIANLLIPKATDVVRASK